VITTVLGDIQPSKLGFCQSHEHLSIARGYPVSVSADQCIDDEEKSRQELELYRVAGGTAVVDAQGLGCGRDAAMLRNISEKSTMHIIASTGFHKMLFYPRRHWIYSISAGDLTKLYLTELNQGMFINCDTAYPVEQIGARAGIIKAALDAGEFSPQYEKLFSAAAEAARLSGVALMVHIEKGSDPIALADFLTNKGVDPRQLVFCHMDRMEPDLGVHRELCSRSINLEYDTIGRPKYHDDETEISIIQELLKWGYEKQLLMSLDTTRSRLRSYGGEPGLAYILERFIPLLRRRDVSEEQINLFFKENPALIFVKK
jgi:phosphotriesterase-related protein